MVSFRTLLLVAAIAVLQLLSFSGFGEGRVIAAEDLSIPATDDGLPGAGPIRRMDWFQKLWVSRRIEFAKSAQQEQGAIVFLGDSITQGWGGRLGAAFGGMKVANRGISGDTTRGMLIRLQDDVLSLNPAAVVILAGTNDLEEGASPEIIAGNMKLILETIKNHNERIPVVLSLVFPSSASRKRPADQIQQINRLYQEGVKASPQVTVIDTWTLFANEAGDAKVEEFPDLLHPNGAGYAKWSAALRPVLATLGFLETTPEEFTLEEGFESLFNGTDLTGWGYLPSSEQDIKSRERWRKNNPDAPPWPIITEAVSFDGKTASSDGRYLARNGRLIVTTPMEGRRIQQIWTTREFPGDFELRLQFRATPNADSGIFIRKPQLQCRDYLLAGPYKELKSYKPQDWNNVVITVKGGVAHCTCNGEVLEAEFKVPETGPIGLEGDRGQMEYRHIRIRQMSN